MNLREHLRLILPEILPTNPAEAIKGTELIRLVRYRLGDEYSDATLRYHFSILSYDPTSPIAKVDQGQGYYLRLKRSLARVQGRSGLFEPPGTETDALRQRYLRALAIFERLSLLRGQFPFVLNGRAGTPVRVESDWEIPDVVCADWEVETGSDEQPRFDETMLSLRRHLGSPEVGLNGVLIFSRPSAPRAGPRRANSSLPKPSATKPWWKPCAAWVTSSASASPAWVLIWPCSMTCLMARTFSA